MTKIPFKKNYLAMIENAAKGENWMFRNFYVEEDSQEADILKDGGLSCAVFVSAILYIFNSTLGALNKSQWISRIHTTVLGTENDMIEFGWYEIQDLKVGAILVWEKKPSSDEKREHLHIGFYVGDNGAISNDSRGKGFIHKHHYTYYDTRKIEKILWHSALDD